MRKLVAEILGTYLLLFAGTGAVVVNTHTGGAVTHVGVCLVWGLIVLAMVYGIGDSSGAHINPAVTLGFAVAGRFAWRRVPGYVIAQLVGAFAASLTLAALFPEDRRLGGTLPAGPPWQSFVFEVILTFMLMFVVLGVSTGAKEKGVLAGIAVGSVIALEALFAGPISGASMNPARSLAPAVVSGRTEHLWIYLLAPPLGAVLGVVGFWASRPDNQTVRGDLCPPA